MKKTFGVLTSFALMQGAFAYQAPIATRQLSPERVQILGQNDDAFTSKLNAVESAQKNIDMIYYLFRSDESSSKLAKAMLAAANERGVKIRLLVDYASNYSNLDFFRMLEVKSKENKVGGKIEVRFYNRPTANIIRDVIFMTSACGEASAKECPDVKNSYAQKVLESSNGNLAKNISNANTGLSGLFLSGLYGKDPKLMAHAMIEGQQIDLSKKDNIEMTPEKKEAVKKLVKLYLKAKFKKGIAGVAAKMKLLVASLMFGKQIKPVLHEIEKTVPFSNPYKSRKKGEERINDWKHLTDYTHHKLLSVDGTFLQMGGRNVENSYHMRPNDLSEKYTFMDTDVAMTFNSSNKVDSELLDHLWNLDSMVATIKDIDQHAPIDALAQKRIAEESCESVSAEQKEACIDAIPLASKADRVANEYVLMQRNSKAYDKYAESIKGSSENTPWSNLSWDFEGASSKITYLENLPFSVADMLNGKELKRGYGAKVNKEADAGKNIQSAWLEALQNACTVKISDKAQGNHGARLQEEQIKPQPQDIVLYNAYVLPSSNVVDLLGKMIAGQGYDCTGVTIKIITNSIQSTDLNIINLFASYAFNEVYNFAETKESVEHGAKLEIHEYQVPATTGQDENSVVQSLHSKVAVINNKVFIGSANLDVRSYMMDTNNSIMIENDQLAELARTQLLALTETSYVAERTGVYKGKTKAQLEVDTNQFIDAMAAKYGIDKKTEPKNIETLKNVAKSLLNEIDELTRANLKNKRPYWIFGTERRFKQQYDDFFKAL